MFSLPGQVIPFPKKAGGRLRNIRSCVCYKRNGEIRLYKADSLIILMPTKPSG